MKRAFVAAGVAIILTGTAAAQDVQPITYQFCTNVGPVELTIAGDSVSGKYLLTVTPDKKRGIIKGIFSQGLIHGTWDDPDEIGKIIIGFNPDRTRFLALYNTSKDASHWYNEWKGVSRTLEGQLSPEEKKDLACDWR